jgi:alpha-tubulin suppressor-like RCC1 family protein
LIGLFLLPGCRDEAPGDESPADAALEPVCGDGVATGDEACDGADLRGQTCVSLGLGAGDGLACSPDCRFDGEACQSSGCGDGFCDPEAGEGQLACPVDCVWTWIMAGERHSCGVRVDGSVWCWGRNHGGQLGGDQGVSSAVPRRVVGVPPAVRLAAGSAHGCALTVGRVVWCWGSNLRGQLGVGFGTAGSLPPTPVSGLTDVVSLAAGVSYTCAVTEAGQALCWGDNSQGQLGSDATINAWLPTPVTTLTDAVTITIGGDDDCPFTCATTVDQVGLCWGCSTRGGLGRGVPMTPPWDSQPAAVQAWSPQCEALAVIVGGRSHACGLTVDGELCCWGSNDTGQMGLALPEALQPTARVLEYPLGTAAAWETVGLGGDHVCAVLRGGPLLCWGANYFGQLGADDALVYDTPQAVAGFGEVLGVDGGVEHTCVLRADGTVWCFGQNFFGQLGDGTTIDRASPGPVAF